MKFSFEFFPPKTPEGMSNLLLTSKRLAELSPEFFSVTFGAGGSTREGTLATVQMLKENIGMNVAPHLACMGCSRSALIDIIKIYQRLGLKRIVALRGDLPSGMGQSGELKFAYELVSLIREVSGDHFYIEVAAYPEFHPQCVTVEDDIMNLKAKMDAGANSAITQYFFNADAYFYLRDACVKHGITLPIVPGIMPITQVAKLIRFSEVCGAEIPQWIRKQLISFEDDVDSIKAFGQEVVYKLCERLLSGGAPGLHFYTLNHAEPSATLVTSLLSTAKLAE